MGNDEVPRRNPTPAPYDRAPSPPDAYGRVSNPERFAVLHEVAAELLRQLARDFDVERNEGYALDPELEKGLAVARSTVMLTPRDAAAAPIVVVFSAFPGLHLRFGRWCTIAFPGCGCDACNENAEDEVTRLKSMIASVIEGRFFEAIRTGATNESTEWTVWSANGREHATLSRDREQVQRLLAGSDRRSYAWKPWSRRGNREST